MSTRCQVQVIQTDLWEDKVTLYKHTDGYPSYMIPIIHKALVGHIERHDKQMAKWNMVSHDQGKPRYESGRAGKVASMLCWADPETFEPEEGHRLHGDIEYYYKLYVSESGWDVEVFDGDGITIIHERMPLNDLLAIYPS